MRSDDMAENNDKLDKNSNVCLTECAIACCQSVRPPLTEHRMKAIKEYIERNNLFIDEPFSYNGKYWYPKEDANGYCIFYSKLGKRCIIHNVKPETCVAGPITFDIDIPNKQLVYMIKKPEVCRLAEQFLKDTNNLNASKTMIRALVREMPKDIIMTLLQIEEDYAVEFEREPLDGKVAAKLQ